MTRELTAFHERAVAAERVGDLEEALAYHSAIPMFSRGRHRSMLEQLSSAVDVLTPWVWVRWIVYLAIRTEGRDSRTGRRGRRALMESLELFHGDLLATAYDEGGDPVKVAARVLGESWACHQLIAHDHGALETLLDDHVGGGLAEHATLARQWVGAPMGGYRIETMAPGSLIVQDLADDRPFVVLDLGAGCVAGLGGTVLGRLVPSGTDPAWMFDTAPLTVDEEIATAIARSPRTWSDVLADAIEDDRLDPACLLREDYEVMSDVAELDLLAFGTRPTELSRVMAQLREGRDEVGRAAFRILRSAADGSLGEEAAPYVGAACLNMHAHHSRHRILAPGQRGQWLRWAELVPPPGRVRLAAYAEATADAA